MGGCASCGDEARLAKLEREAARIAEATALGSQWASLGSSRGGRWIRVGFPSADARFPASWVAVRGRRIFLSLEESRHKAPGEPLRGYFCGRLRVRDGALVAGGRAYFRTAAGAHRSPLALRLGAGPKNHRNELHLLIERPPPL